MIRSFPSDIVILDRDALTLVRFSRGKNREILQVKAYRLNEAFSDAAVTPALSNPNALAEAIRRARTENGNIERVALLLPDSWFRMNLLDFAQLSERKSEADEMVRWALKRTLPIAPELLRLAYTVVGRQEAKRRVFVLSAMNATLSTLEKTFADHGIATPIVEPLGLNLWNAITIREATTAKSRLFFHVRENEFTSGVFRGSEPLFLRSRNLSGERTVAQEIRLSASYLRDNLQLGDVEACYLASSTGDSSISQVIQDQFGVPVRRLELREFATIAPGLDTTRLESELIACNGVFAA